MLIETDLLRSTFGGWDSVRFIADSELLERMRKILGRAVFQTDKIGMVCLDSLSSLSNHSEYGVSKDHGLSPIRREYQIAFREWHRSMDTSETHMDIMSANRPFPAPQAMLVSPKAIAANARAQDAQIDSLRQL